MLLVVHEAVSGAYGFFLDLLFSSFSSWFEPVFGSLYGSLFFLTHLGSGIVLTLSYIYSIVVEEWGIASGELIIQIA